MELETQHGAAASYVSSLPAKITLLLGKGVISNRLRALGSHLLSPLKPAPVIRPTNEAWGVKNASYVAMQLMLAATSLGLRTLPMEGFDERRLSAALKIPVEDYCVPVVICVGHSADPNDPLKAFAAEDGEAPGTTNPGGTERKQGNSVFLRKKVRFDIEEVCFLNTFGNTARFD
jgi:nitroreductase